MTCPSEPVTKAGSFDKIKAMRDPYTIASEEFANNFDDLTEVTYLDIFSYLVLEHSKYTADEFKAYKGLQAFNQANNGWVTNVAIYASHIHQEIF
ncbi:hypothetical protein PoB_001342100 [Plakobranchus ocellatus]|uniref:Uncharacterized protein n=1 Tax=Plakobranchus ocellatus TaxID=259542 RepID=A0AAV3YI06_9GAST|nr:hypothetical protein PoB_001342100 [Plakobranchus ocellatus]